MHSLAPVPAEAAEGQRQRPAAPARAGTAPPPAPPPARRCCTQLERGSSCLQNMFRAIILPHPEGNNRGNKGNAAAAVIRPEAAKLRVAENEQILKAGAGENAPG